MLKTTHIRATFRKPVKAPSWWEGHVICYKEYQFGGGENGLCTLNLSSRDACHQKSAPYNVGDFLTVSVGAVKMRGQISDIDIYRPGWSNSHAEPDTFDTEEDPGEWIITIDFPRISASQS
jgi:hypothetical protein